MGKQKISLEKSDILCKQFPKNRSSYFVIIKKQITLATWN